MMPINLIDAKEAIHLAAMQSHSNLLEERKKKLEEPLYKLCSDIEEDIYGDFTSYVTFLSKIGKKIEEDACRELEDVKSQHSINDQNIKSGLYPVQTELSPKEYMEKYNATQETQMALARELSASKKLFAEKCQKVGQSLWAYEQKKSKNSARDEGFTGKLTDTGNYKVKDIKKLAERSAEMLEAIESVIQASSELESLLPDMQKKFDALRDSSDPQIGCELKILSAEIKYNYTDRTYPHIPYRPTKIIRPEHGEEFASYLDRKEKIAINALLPKESYEAYNNADNWVRGVDVIKMGQLFDFNKLFLQDYHKKDSLSLIDKYDDYCDQLDTFKTAIKEWSAKEKKIASESRDSPATPAQGR